MENERQAGAMSGGVNGKAKFKGQVNYLFGSLDERWEIGDLKDSGDRSITPSTANAMKWARLHEARHDKNAHPLLLGLGTFFTP